MAIGLGLVVGSLFVPFGVNPAGGIDHSYDAGRWYVWDPSGNPGVVFVLVGVVGMVCMPWGRPRRLGRRWTAALCGLFGAFLAVVHAPEFVQNAVLYGGPSLEPRGGGVILAVGCVVLFLAACRNLLPDAWDADPDRGPNGPGVPLSR